jgi:TetR/AcrR family transcriptional repressor for divergent bdcA
MALFHAKGYDAVSVSDLTQALGINAPSFYAAYGSKAGLFERVLGTYSRTDAIPVAEMLQSDRPVVEALTAVLHEAARRYAADPDSLGCLVLEAARCGDPEARELANASGTATADVIRSFVAARHPSDADRLSDYVMTMMAGLSAAARAGVGRKRLLAIAEIAGQGLAAAMRLSRRRSPRRDNPDGGPGAA